MSRSDITRAWKKLHKAAEEHPAWFDMANRVLRRYHADEMLLLHALMEGLQEAWRLGQINTLPEQDPKLKTLRDDGMGQEENEEEDDEETIAIDCKPVAPAGQTTRTARRAAPPELPVDDGEPAAGPRARRTRPVPVPPQRRRRG